MRARSLNLYSRILLWLLVNVLVLGASFWLVLQWQFREGMQGALGVSLATACKQSGVRCMRA